MRPLVLVALLTLTLAAPTRAQTSTVPGPQDAVFTITAPDIGVEPSDNGKDIGGRLLFGWARYQAGDDPAWADPAYDYQDWEIAGIGLRADGLPRQGWPGIGWFRIRLRVDDSLRDHDLGFVLVHFGAIEAYLDGTLVYRSGTVGSTSEEEEPYVDRDPFTLPLEAGSEHVLALRYSNFVSQGFRTQWYYTGFGLYWGDRATMMHHRGFVRFNQGVFLAFFLAFALLFGLLYGLYRSERLFLYMALFFGLLVPFPLIGGQLPFVHAPALVMPLLVAFFAFAIGVLLAMLLILYAFFYPTRPKAFYAFLLAGLAATLAVFFRLENAIYVFFLGLLVNIETLRVVGVALWRKKRWAWIVGAGVAPSIIIQFWEQLGMLGVLVTPWSSTPFNPNMISMLFFSSACAVYVATRFAEANKGLTAANEALAEANRTLEDRVSRRTAALRASQAQLIHNEKMASLGQLTAGVAHEIKNPLNFVNNFSEIVVELSDELTDLLDPHLKTTLQREADDFRMILSDLRVNSTKIGKHGKRADGIVKSMLEHARPATGKRKDTDINALLDEYIHLCEHNQSTNGDERRITFVHEYDAAVGLVEAVPQEIGRVFLNLLNNAVYAVRQKTDADKTYQPIVTVSTHRTGKSIEIRVKDNGPGIPTAIQTQIFEPFFTTKPPGGGTGLGLSISYEIITQGHSGTLTVESHEGHGATFIISLPG